MDRDRRSGTSLRLLELVLLAAVTAEVAFGRLLVRGLEKKPVYVKGEPQKIVPPTWFVALDYVALFLLYFVAAMGVVVLAQRVRNKPVDAAVSVFMALVVAIAAVVDPDFVQTFLHVALLAVAIYTVSRVWLTSKDLGAQIGTTIIAAPILIYCVMSLFAGFLWTEDQMLGGEAKAEIGKMARNALVIAAIASPYCLSPRPFARSMTRILPFLVALVIAGTGAVALRLDYPSTVKAVNRVLGLELRVDAAQDQIALYLLAFATITWTTVACMTAPSPSRRRIGYGLALLVMAGHGFAWPASFVTAAVGLLFIGDGAAKVRDEERAAFIPVTPPIEDEAWQAFVGHVVAALRTLAGDDSAVSAVSVRGEGEHTSTVVVTERRGVPVRLRIERMARAVVVVDIVCGREVDAGRSATWSIVSRGGGHPEPPPAGPLSRVDDAPFDERFRVRGDLDSLKKLLDDGLRARTAASLDGWLAYWHGQSLRHRVFPGQGAPLDVPIPLSQLSVERRATAESAERLVRVLELCAEIAAPALASTADEPVALAEAP
jgi:hypothetical protein